MDGQADESRRPPGGGPADDVDDLFREKTPELSIADGPPGAEETIERPIAELIAPEVISAGSRWLTRWLILGGLSAGMLALASIGTAVLEGGRLTEWLGFLPFACAVLILVIPAYLAGGMPGRFACHGAFSVAGLIAAGLPLMVALLRFATPFIESGRPQAPLAEFVALGLLSLAGLIIFTRCLESHSWACRVASLATAIFLGLVLVDFVSNFYYLGVPDWLAPALTGRHWWGMLITVLAAGGFALSWDWMSKSNGAAAMRILVADLWLLAMIAGAAFAAYTLRRDHGAAEAVRQLWTASAVWEAFILAPLVVAGMSEAGRRRGAFAADMLDTTRFGWLMVTIGALACVALAVPAFARHEMAAPTWMVAAAAAALIGAWLGATKGNWVSQWALIPAVLLEVGLLCGLSSLADAARAGGDFWFLLVVFLWCCVATAVAFAIVGLAIQWGRSRLEDEEPALWVDANLINTTGLLIGAVLLWIMFALTTASQPAAAGLEGLLLKAADHARDILALGTPAWVSDRLQQAVWAVRQVWKPATAMAVAVGLIGVCVVHMLAKARTGWSMYVVAAFWWLPLLAASLLVIGLAARSVLPCEPFHPATVLGQLMVSSLTARLVVVGVSAVATVRYCVSFWSVVLLCCRQGAGEAAPLPPAEDVLIGEPRDRSLVFIVRLGVLLAVTALSVAVVSFPLPALRQFTAGLADMAHQWVGEAGVIARWAGQASARWGGYALGAGLVLYLLIALNVEARRGRVAVYPLLGLFWALVLGGSIGIGFRTARAAAEADASSTVMVVAAGALPVIAILAATAALLLRWWRLRQAYADEIDEMFDPVPEAGPAFGLGTLGLALCVYGAGLAVHVALRDDPLYADYYATATALARSVWHQAVLWAVARTMEWSAQRVLVTSSVLAVGGAAVLALHLLARAERRAFRVAVCAFWAAVAAVWLGTAAYALLRGRKAGLSAPQLVGTLVVMWVLLHVVVALTRCRRWLMTPPQDEG